MAKKIFGEIKPWDGTSGTGADARALIKANFALVNEAIDELMVSAQGFYDVSAEIPLTPGTYYTFETARMAVPTNIRAKKLTIAFDTSATTFEMHEFYQGEVSAWTTEGNWRNNTSKALFAIAQVQAGLNTESAARIAGDQSLSDKVDTAVAGYLGSIAYNATAPTPGKDGWYRFNTGGSCTFLTGGAQTVAAEDILEVTFAAGVHTYKRTPHDSTAQDLFNVTVKVPLSAGSYYTDITARNAVPVANRKPNLFVTHISADGSTVLQQFVGSNIGAWSVALNWKNSGLIYKTGKNKFNVNSAENVPGYYVDPTNGNLIVNASYNTSHWMRVNPSTVYHFSNANKVIWADAALAFISGTSGGSATKTSPSNANYVRISDTPAYFTPLQVEETSGTVFEAFTEWYEYQNIKVLGSQLKDLLVITSQIADAAITAQKTDFIVPGKNKFNINASDVSLAHYVASADGVLYPNSAYNATGLTPVMPGQVLTLSVGGQIAFYDINKARIGGINGANAVPYTLTVPANTFFMKGSVLIAYWTFFQIEIGSSVTAFEAYKNALKIEYIPASVTPFINDIAIPAKLYMLSGTQNDMFIEPIMKRWKPFNDSVRFSGTAAFTRRLQRVASVSVPVDGATIISTLINHDSFSTVKSKTSTIVLGTKSVGSTEIDVQIIGDSFTNGAFFKDALLDKGYCPNIKMIGLRKVASETNQHDEGRGGWTLANYMTVTTDVNNLNPFFQPDSTFKYWGSTGFWINAWKVFRGTAGGGTEPTYSAGRYDDVLSLFDETTGFKLTPTTNDIVYDSTAATYKIWSGSAWVATTYATYAWSFNYTKYLAMWSLTTPTILAIMLGLNDFRDNTDPENISFTAWNTNMNAVKAAYLAAVPTGRFVICIPSSSCGIMDNEGGYFTIRQNAAMWLLRKNIIDTYDAREAESIYLVDVGITIDNYAGMSFSSDTTQTKPYSAYAGSDTIKVQTGNPHPYPNYPTMGIPLAAFIQKYR
jgi:hypothetical protein